jgi:iron complex transport system ATP-binding protein
MDAEKELSTIILETKGLGIGYRTRRSLDMLHDRLDLSLHRGDLVCLIGPNGSGKSTLVRTLGGLQPALRGKVFIDGKDIGMLKDSERSKKLSMVLTDKTAVDNITLSEIVSLGRYADTNWLGKMNDEDIRIVRSALQLVGLYELRDRYYGTLSDGEKQRAFIAKALASKAPLMLLDEPTAHLDIPNRVEIMLLLRKLTRKNHQSVLVSTHDLELALQLADEIWLLDRETSILCTTPEEAMKSGVLNNAFGSESVEFHPEFERFVIKSKPNARLFVSGEGMNYKMTIHALERIGFAVGEDEKDMNIHVEEQHWEVRYGKASSRFENLGDLIRHLRIIHETGAGKTSAKI